VSPRKFLEIAKTVFFYRPDFLLNSELTMLNHWKQWEKNKIILSNTAVQLHTRETNKWCSINTHELAGPTVTQTQTNCPADCQSYLAALQTLLTHTMIFSSIVPRPPPLAQGWMWLGSRCYKYATAPPNRPIIFTHAYLHQQTTWTVDDWLHWMASLLSGQL